MYNYILLLLLVLSGNEFFKRFLITNRNLIIIIIGSALADIDPLTLIPKDDIEKVVKEKCEKNGGTQAYDKLDVSKLFL